MQSNTLDAFGAEIADLGRRLRAEAGASDLRHLRKIECAGRVADVLGFATIWIAPNPLSAALLAFAMMVRFVVGHQIMHGGYDNIANVPYRYTRAGFGRGWRSLIDWLDWWTLADWRHTHHRLHHAHTQAPGDTDIMDSRYLLHRPTWQRWFVLAALMGSWKAIYYAPKLRQTLRAADGTTAHPAATYLVVRFLLPFGIAASIDWWIALSVLCNLLMAELIHGMHTFAVITPSHCAGDIPLFAARHSSRTEFYLQSVLGTVNYRPSGEIMSLIVGWQNYQIEHHLFPATTLLRYRLAAPLVQVICARHSVPYRTEPVRLRFWRMARLFVGIDHQITVDTRSQVGR